MMEIIIKLKKEVVMKLLSEDITKNILQTIFIRDILLLVAKTISELLHDLIKNV